MDQNFLNEINEIKNQFRIIVLGSPKTGKTSIVNWFLGEPMNLDSYIPTIENFHKKLFKIRGELFSLEIIDTSGIGNPYPAGRYINI